MLTWNQLGLIAKPIGLINTAGYFDGIIMWVRRAVDEGMVKSVFADCLFVDEDPAELLNKMKQFKPNPEAAKFFTKA